jgi:SAM-dependent methyltransferase
MAFDYESSTREAYKDAQTAADYHSAFTGHVTWKTFRAHFIAKREKIVVATFIEQLGSRKVLDIPCGTGKLASVLAEHGCEVIGADIAPSMLAIAEATYERLLGDRGSVEICDIEDSAARFADAGVDTVVCLRLMHRVPPEVRDRALEAIARTAPRSIVSFGISSSYHRVRKRVRNVVFGEPWRRLCQETMVGIRGELERHFEIRRMRRVAPALSEEVVFLLESRR